MTSLFKPICQTNSIRRFFCNCPTNLFEEIRIPVPWGYICAKWWHPTETRPILAVHGWQDNCGTFDRLIPLLEPNVGILAIDLPGHGLSSRLPPGMFYHNMNYVILIDQIYNYFKWNKISLLGHSLGAVTNYVYTMLFPEKVDFLINIDGFKPIHKQKNAPRMAKGMQELLRYDKLMQSTSEPPSYPLELLMKKMSETNNNSIDYENTLYILERNMARSEKDPNKYYLTRDARLKTRLIFNWSQEDILEGARRIENPCLFIKFKQSSYFEDKKYVEELIEVLKTSSCDLQMYYIDGSHHAHLNHPERISEIISDFIETYDHEDRSKGGLIV